jgi:hypothetical protein
VPTSGAFEALGAMAHQFGQYAQRQKEQQHQDELTRQQFLQGLVVEGIRSGRVEPQAAMQWYLGEISGKGGKGRSSGRRGGARGPTPGAGGGTGAGGVSGGPHPILGAIIGGIMHHAPKAEIQGPGLRPPEEAQTGGGMPPWKTTAEVAAEEALTKAGVQTTLDRASYEERAREAREQGLTGRDLQEFLLTGKLTTARPFAPKVMGGRPTHGPDLPPDAVDFKGNLIPDEGRGEDKYWQRELRTGPDGEPQEVYSPVVAPAGGAGGASKGASLLRQIRLESPALAERTANLMAAAGIFTHNATEEDVMRFLPEAGKLGTKAEEQKAFKLLLNIQGLIDAAKNRKPDTIPVTADLPDPRIGNVPQERFGGLTEAAVYEEAITSAVTGRPPALGISGAGNAGKARTAILNKRNQMLLERDVYGPDLQAEYQANLAAMRRIGTIHKMVSMYSGAFEQYVDLAKELETKVPRTGSPIVNHFKLWARRQIWPGDPAIVALENAIYPLVREYAKITTGAAAGSAQLTDTATLLSEKLLGPFLNHEQFLAAINPMVRDVQILKDSATRELNTINAPQMKRFLGIPETPTTTPQVQTQTQTDDPRLSDPQIRLRARQALINAHKQATDETVTTFLRNNPTFR